MNYQVDFLGSVALSKAEPALAAPTPCCLPLFPLIKVASLSNG